jgi:hypothetical protein
MITIGQDLKNELQSYEITPVTLVTLEFPNTAEVPAGGTMWLTDAPRDISVGGITYFSSDQIHSISVPQTQNSVDRDNYSITFTDNDNAMRTRFGVSHTGVPLTVQVAFRKEDGSLTDEILNVYKGQSSTVHWFTNEESALCAVGFTGQLAQLSSSKTLSTTPASQESIDPSDTCMNFSHNSVEDESLKWGKE